MFDEHLFWFCLGVIVGVAVTGLLAIRIMTKTLRALKESLEGKKPL